MPINYSPRVVRELNTQLVSCFTDGVNDAVNQIHDLYSADGSPLGMATDLVFRATSDTAETAFVFPEMHFEISSFGTGDETPEEGIKLYEHRIASGPYKGKVIPVNLADFEDDKVGQYRVVFYKLGGALVRAPLRLIESTLVSANALVSDIDGVPLISQQHVTKPQEAFHATHNPYQSNDIVQAGGMTFTNFAALYAKNLAFKGEDGVALEENLPQYLWFDPDYLGTAMDICFNDRPSTLQGGGNPWKGKVRPLMVRRLQGTGRWGLADSWNALERPLIYVEREALKLRPLFTNPEDPIVRERRQMKWQLDGRISCGVGSWKKIIQSRPS